MPVCPQHDDGNIHLMLRVSRGDHQAYEKIWRKYYPVVLDFLTSLECHMGLADDLSQEVFCRAWEFRQRFRGGSSVKSYLFGLANNVLLEHLRNLSRQIPTVRNEILDRCLSHPDALSEPEAGTYNAELAEILRQALSQLSPKQIEAIRLSCVENRGHLEASKQANCSIHAFRNRHLLACRQLRESLGHSRPQ